MFALLLVTMFVTSCVQSDLYDEFYDDDMPSWMMFARRKFKNENGDQSNNNSSSEDEWPDAYEETHPNGYENPWEDGGDDDYTYPKPIVPIVPDPVVVIHDHEHLPTVVYDRIPGLMGSHNLNPDCEYKTLNCIVRFILGREPDESVVRSVCNSVGYDGMPTMRDALTGIIGYYWSVEAVQQFFNNLYHNEIVGYCSHSDSFSEWDVVRTRTINVPQWVAPNGDNNHMFVVNSNCYISPEDYSNVNIPDGYVMYGGQALSSKSDDQEIKFHKDWFDDGRRIKAEVFINLRNAYQNRNN